MSPASKFQSRPSREHTTNGRNGPGYGSICPSLNLDDVRVLTGGRLGTHDVPCPQCGPGRNAIANRKRPVLRIWFHDDSFATYCCARCGMKGHARSRRAEHRSVPGQAVHRRRLEDLDQVAHKKRLQLARYLWSRRQSAEGTVVQTYLRHARRYGGRVASTIGFLPGSAKYPPTMIASFGLPDEMAPEQLTMGPDAVQGVHLTPLLDTGAGKAGKPIMIGRSLGWPLVLSALGDSLSLVICEGIETGLSLYEATGCGVWAAGGATRLPALASAVPHYVDCVTIAAEPDEAGRKGAAQLAAALTARGIACDLRFLSGAEACAA